MDRIIFNSYRLKKTNFQYAIQLKQFLFSFNSWKELSVFSQIGAGGELAISFDTNHKAEVKA